jgi:pimeloyl-ACP methyl ester carboxylesterase
MTSEPDIEAPDHLAVFMEGTANTLQPVTTQIGQFFELTDATNALDPMYAVDGTFTAVTDPLHWKLGFDGCGVTNGIAGVIWAIGLSSQCSDVIKRVRKLLVERTGRRLRVTVVGLSRGGVGALMLAKRIGELLENGFDDPTTRSRLTLSLLLFDPVPGNLICTARFLDPFGLSTAASVGGGRPV